MTDFADNTTAHGVARISNASNCFVGFIWLLILCGAFAVFFLQGTNLVLDFFSWPYGTTIDVISKTNVEFPAVTVCNFNKYRESALTAADLRNVGTHLGEYNHRFTRGTVVDVDVNFVTVLCRYLSLFVVVVIVV